MKENIQFKPQQKPKVLAGSIFVSSDIRLHLPDKGV
jgi:hypothetical protein